MKEVRMMIYKVFINNKSKATVYFRSEKSLKIGTIVKALYKDNTKYFEISSKTISSNNMYMYEAVAFGYGEDILKDCDFDIINLKLSVENDEEVIRSLKQRSCWC